MTEHISIADIQSETQLERHKINHALMRHGPPPRGRIGITRVWFRSDLPAIRAALRKTGHFTIDNGDAKN